MIDKEKYGSIVDDIANASVKENSASMLQITQQALTNRLLFEIQFELGGIAKSLEKIFNEKAYENQERGRKQDWGQK